jgi:hypothetical protein
MHNLFMTVIDTEFINLEIRFRYFGKLCKSISQHIVYRPIRLYQFTLVFLSFGKLR